MVKRKTRKKQVAKKDAADWHLKLAFTLGKTVKKASQKVAKAKKASQGRLSRKRTRTKSGAVSRIDEFLNNSDEPMSPILKELKGISDVSGLTAAVEEMNEISLKHSSHPVVSRLVAKVQQLSPTEQEMLSRKFIDRLHASPYFSNAMFMMPLQGKMTEEECQKISDAFIECVSHTLEDIGMTPEEREFLQKFSDDVTRPLNELVQFYLHPKTFGQKVKRLWRMQRIIIRMIKLVNMSNTLAMKEAQARSTTIGSEGPVPSSYWQNLGDKPIVIKEKNLKI
ncbi:MAG: hypothetical protein HQL18_00085 [Candidatus Omnitrophica bacterium]|nr:hypothetical protein [Candidatus Omnitrophota bacterium]